MSNKDHYDAKDILGTKYIKGNEAHYDALEWEATAYYTLNDAYDLINDLGLKNFLEMLYHDKKRRLLTVEEHEAMQTLHDSWEL